MIITEISACKKSKDRCNIYIDGGFACALFSDTVLEYGLKTGKEISKENLEKITFEDGCKKCLMKGYYLLSFRSRGEKELRMKLMEKGFEKAQVDKAIDMLIRRGYIDDNSYASEYAEYLQKKGYGGFAIKQRLMRKGIDSDVISLVMEGISSEDNMEAALEYGRRAYVRASREEDKFKRKQKFLGAMSRHGFDYSTAKEVFERLEEDYD